MAKSGFSYEFGGPVGALGTMIGLPCVIVYLLVSISKFSGKIILDTNSLLDGLRAMQPTTAEYVEATKINLTWISFCVALSLFLPGQWVEGE